MAARAQEMFCNFYLVENSQIPYNSSTTDDRKEIMTDLESLCLKKYILIVGFTEFKSNQVIGVEFTTLS